MCLPPLRFWFRLHHEHLDRIPSTGPAIIACNHISYLDPLTNGDAVVRAGRRPRFLAKEDLFRIPIVGRALRGAGQIPVSRGTRNRSSLDRALTALARGELIVVYPEGTVTKRDDGLPMEGKTGVVRLALASGVPITPMASWGSQAVWQKSGKGSLKFGRPIWTTVGEPIELPVIREGEQQALRESTAQVMDAITFLVVDLHDRYPRRWTK
ncbi:MAG TPA: lysophospholipid acyltransferase family protein [Actinomycetota bacterium]|nr:lysophospholipid acyltransferase family protein [Actinomycetota bacterium]